MLLLFCLFYFPISFRASKFSKLPLPNNCNNNLLKSTPLGTKNETYPSALVLETALLPSGTTQESAVYSEGHFQGTNKIGNLFKSGTRKPKPFLETWAILRKLLQPIFRCKNLNNTPSWDCPNCPKRLPIVRLFVGGVIQPHPIVLPLHLASFFEAIFVPCNVGFQPTPHRGLMHINTKKLKVGF